MRTRVCGKLGTWLGSMWSARRAAHLTDRELVRILVDADDGISTATGKGHLAACSLCATRIRTLQSGLDRITAAAESAFDDAIPAWRLVRQRHRIVRRIQRAAGRRGSARILRFPTAVPRAGGAQPARRWLSLAAVGAILLAVGLGQVIDERRRPAGSPRSAAAAPSQPIIGPPAGQPQAVADEQFMRELEEALTSSRVTPLVALDEMTPRVRAAAIDIR